MKFNYYENLLEGLKNLNSNNLKEDWDKDLEESDATLKKNIATEDIADELSESKANKKYVIYRITDYTDNRGIASINKTDIKNYLNDRIGHNIVVYQNEAVLISEVPVINYAFERGSSYGYSKQYYQFPNIGEHYKTTKLNTDDIENILAILLDTEADTNILYNLMIKLSGYDVIDKYPKTYFKYLYPYHLELHTYLLHSKTYGYHIVIDDSAVHAEEDINWHHGLKGGRTLDSYYLVKDKTQLSKYLNEGVSSQANKKCVICGKEYTGYGNNAQPVKKG